MLDFLLHCDAADSRAVPRPAVDDGTKTKAAAASNGSHSNTADADDSGGSDDDEAAEEGGAPAAGDAKKKKKRKPRKKKKAGAAGTASKQSDPPRVPVANFFPQSNFPAGEEVPYLNDNAFRTTSEEKRHLDRLNQDFLTEYRHGAEVHRQVRQHAQRWIKPGKTLHEIADMIEDGTRALTGHPGLEEGDHLKAGIGFPTGLSINHCAAHYTPNTSSSKWVLQEEDVLKVDIGVHTNGRIVDSAFTLAFQPQYDPLLDAVKAATNAGIKEAGIDVRMGDIGAVVQEVMESYEITLPAQGSNSTADPGRIGTQTTHVKPIRNLNGHNIDQYRIHGGKSVPIVKGGDQTKMEEGEVFAIETFGSTGKGYVHEDMECSHYAKVLDDSRAAAQGLRVQSAKSLLRTIDKNFGTLPFCRRYLDRLGCEKYLLGLNNLVSSGIVESYPPLVDIKGSYTAQFEHVSLPSRACASWTRLITIYRRSCSGPTARKSSAAATTTRLLAISDLHWDTCSKRDDTTPSKTRIETSPLFAIFF